MYGLSAAFFPPHLPDNFTKKDQSLQFKNILGRQIWSVASKRVVEKERTTDTESVIQL